MEKPRMVKAILICPFSRTVTEVQHNAKNYRHICELLSHPEHPVDCFTCVSINDVDAIYVDDNGLMNDPKKFFLWRGYQQPMAGRGLILGTDQDGETIGTGMTVEQVVEKVRFSDSLRVAGFEPIKETHINHPILGPTPVFGSRPVFQIVDPDDD